MYEIVYQILATECIFVIHHIFRVINTKNSENFINFIFLLKKIKSAIHSTICALKVNGIEWIGTANKLSAIQYQ